MNPISPHLASHDELLAAPGARRPKFRIGLIVDDGPDDPYVAEFAASLLRDPAFDVVVVRQQLPAQRRRLRDALFRLGQFGETAVFKNHKTNFPPFPAHSIIATPIFDPIKSAVTYSPADVAAVAATEPAILVNLSGHALSGAILDAAPHGVVICSADFSPAGRAANGFAEVSRRAETTAFSIGLVPGSNKPAIPLVEASFGTRYLGTVNSAEIRSRTLVRLREVLERMRLGQQPALGGAARTATAPPSYTRAASPSIASQISYAGNIAGAIAGKAVRRLQKKKCNWRLGYVYGDWTSDLSQCVVVPPPPGRFIADPFVISRDGEDYIFAEDYDWATGRGDINVFKITAGGATELGRALVEPFHLSFPYLLTIDGRLHMLPETSEAGEIRLYECVEFPLKWKHTATLMKDVSAADTMMFKRDGLWWLLTNIDRQGNGDHGSEFDIFYSADPFSTDWTPHAANPISLDAWSGRNGGLFGDWDGKLYRVVQVPGFDTYGRRSRVFEITALDPQTYSEKLVRTIDPGFLKGMTATHHLHSNGQITVFDFIA